MDDLTARIMRKIKKQPGPLNSPCWVVSGTNAEGYGQIRVDGVNRGLHRVAYEVWIGGIPDGLHIDHLCRNRACCNPQHLEPVSVRENSLRGNTLPAANARKVACPYGHPYDAENTSVIAGKRNCRTCNRERMRRRRIERGQRG